MKKKKTTKKALRRVTRKRKGVSALPIKPLPVHLPEVERGIITETMWDPTVPLPAHDPIKPPPSLRAHDPIKPPPGDEGETA